MSREGGEGRGPRDSYTGLGPGAASCLQQRSEGEHGRQCRLTVPTHVFHHLSSRRRQNAAMVRDNLTSTVKN